VEVLVASTISGFLAVVAVGALNALSTSAQSVQRVTETTAEVRFAAQMLARDLSNLYRDANAENMRLLGASQGSETGGPPFLTFYMTGRAKARADQPEGDVYEVEYFLGQRDQEENTEAPLEQEATVLFRRLWPNPDKERNPGGILTPIAEGLGIFEIRFFNGTEWVSEWTEEMRSLPALIEITLASLPPGRGDPIVEMFTVSFPRLSKALANALPAGATPEGQGGQQGGSAGSSAESAPASTGAPSDSKSSGPR
jgi:type II secretion system protein J